MLTSYEKQGHRVLIDPEARSVFLSCDRGTEKYHIEVTFDLEYKVVNISGGLVRRMGTQTHFAIPIHKENFEDAKRYEQARELLEEALHKFFPKNPSAASQAASATHH